MTERVFDELWDRRTPLRLLGVSLGQITWEEDPQLSFFEDEDREKARKLDRVVDDTDNTVDLVSMKESAKGGDFFTRLKNRVQR